MKVCFMLSFATPAALLEGLNSLAFGSRFFSWWFVVTSHDNSKGYKHLYGSL